MFVPIIIYNTAQMIDDQCHKNTYCRRLSLSVLSDRKKYLLKGQLLAIYLLDTLHKALLQINDVLRAFGTHDRYDPVRSFWSLLPLFQDRDDPSPDRKINPSYISFPHAGTMNEEENALEGCSAVSHSFLPSRPATATATDAGEGEREDDHLFTPHNVSFLSFSFDCTTSYGRKELRCTER